MFPARHSPAFAPATACGVLVLLVALQLGLSVKTELPQDAGLSPRRARSPMAAPIPGYPALSASNVFSPDRAGGAAGMAGSIDDCSAVGVVMIGRAAAGLVKAPGGASELVRPGQIACGWRLSHIERNTLDFEHDGQHRRLVVGDAALSSTHAPPQPPQGAEPAQ